MSLRLTGDYTEDTSNARNGSRLITSLLSNTPVQANRVRHPRGPQQPEAEHPGRWPLAGRHRASCPTRSPSRASVRIREDRSFTPIDFDALPAVDVDVPAVYRNEQTSQEFQLAYKSEKLNGLDRLLLSREPRPRPGSTCCCRPLSPNFNAYTKGDVRTETSSIFGDFTYDFTDAVQPVAWWPLHMGRASVRTMFKASYLRPDPRIRRGAGSIRRTVDRFHAAWPTSRRFTPRASLNFKPTPDHLLYASYSEGFQGRRVRSARLRHVGAKARNGNDADLSGNLQLSVVPA